jgi:hypothetical protein
LYEIIIMWKLSSATLCLALNHQSGDLIVTMLETWKL